MKIAVLMGGSSAERDASLENGKRIIAALEEAENTPVAIDVSEDLVATLRAERPDACIVAVAGKMGEDGTLQGLLDSWAFLMRGLALRCVDRLPTKACFLSICKQHAISLASKP